MPGIRIERGKLTGGHRRTSDGVLADAKLVRCKADRRELIDARIEKLLVEQHVDQSVTLRIIQIYKGKCYNLGTSNSIERELTKRLLARLLLAMR